MLQSTLAIALCCPCLILLYRHAVHTEYCLMLSMLNIALCWPCSMISTLNIALTAVYTLNTALRCPRSILPYSHAVHAQYCLELSIRLILPYSHTVHAQYCHMLSTLAIALCCPHWLLPYAVNAHALCCPCLILPYRHAVHAQDSPVYA